MTEPSADFIALWCGIDDNGSSFSPTRCLRGTGSHRTVSKTIVNYMLLFYIGADRNCKQGGSNEARTYSCGS